MQAGPTHQPAGIRRLPTHEAFRALCLRWHCENGVGIAARQRRSFEVPCVNEKCIDPRFFQSGDSFLFFARGFLSLKTFLPFNNLQPFAFPREMSLHRFAVEVSRRELAY
jgi:hypothetical protein